jgi:hypothetical protein
MSLRHPEMLDIVVKQRGGDGYRLIAYDEGDIQDPDERFRLMMEKLATYVHFVASGQFFEQYPDARDKALTITVVCKTPPSDTMICVEGVASREQPDIRVAVEVLSDDQLLAALSPAKAGKREHAAKARCGCRFSGGSGSCSGTGPFHPISGFCHYCDDAMVHDHCTSCGRALERLPRPGQYCDACKPSSA